MPDIRTLPPSRLHRIAEMLRPFSIATQVARLHGLPPAIVGLAATMPTPLSGIYVPGFLSTTQPPSTNEEQP